MLDGDGREIMDGWQGKGKMGSYEETVLPVDYEKCITRRGLAEA